MLDIYQTALSNGTANIGNDDNKRHSIASSEDARPPTFVPLSEKIDRYHNSTHNVPFFSVEFFPPRTDRSASTLIQLLDRFREGDPYFCDITWHAAGSPGLEKPTSSITIAGVALNYCALETMLHITCIGLTAVDVRQHLERAKRLGIRNILALRGDMHADSKTYDFHYATDLVRFIRQEYGNYFTIVVAGYPIPHCESDSKEADLQHLKEKVDAGADVVITQLFFEAEDYIDFVTNCRQIGITVPIIPGIIALNSYQSILKLSSLSSVPIPERMLHDLEPIKSNDEAVRNYGVDFLVDMCRKLISANLSPGLHFYTLNQDTVIRVLKTLGLWKKLEITTLPWRPCTNHRRIGEKIRPVFWVNRPKSYIHRTAHWKEYPFNFWSAKFSKQITDSLQGFYSFLEIANKKEELDRFLGEDEPSPANLCQVFYSFYEKYSNNFDINTNATKAISTIPWVQQPNSYFLESLFHHYGQFIMKGALITNYLPSLNGISSDDVRHGWGVPSGTIFQKEYLEFFLDPTHLEQLQSILERLTGVISYCITNRSGSVKVTNWPQSNHPMTLCWGLFPRYQASVAHVADLITFDIWREECFGLLSGWLSLYQPDSGPYRVIRHIQEDYLLVSLIGNQFVSVATNTAATTATNAEAGFTSMFNQLFAL